MPIEITTGGVQKLFGPAKSVAEFVAVRQDLPPEPEPVPPANDVQGDKMSSDAIEKKVETLNSQIQYLQRDLLFSIDADSGRTIIRVIDSKTRETIRTIPPEDISVLARSLERHSGVLFSTSV